MLLRRDAASDREPSRAGAPVRVPSPGVARFDAGQDFKAPGLFKGEGSFARGAASELDDLFAAGESIRGVGGQSQMPSGLRSDASHFQGRFTASRRYQVEAGLARRAFATRGRQGLLRAPGKGPKQIALK